MAAIGPVVTVFGSARTPPDHPHYELMRAVGAALRFASAFVIGPGGFGTLDELFEALTLIQTETIRHFPVILMGR